MKELRATSILTPLLQEIGGKITTDTMVIGGQTCTIWTTPDDIEVLVADEDGGVSISIAPRGEFHNVDCMLGKYNPQTGSYTIFTDKDDAIRTILQTMIADRSLALLTTLALAEAIATIREGYGDEVAEIAAGRAGKSAKAGKGKKQ